MKKIEKLNINSDKLLKNEELIRYRGGYGGDCNAMCFSYSNGLLGTRCLPACYTQEEQDWCKSLGGNYSTCACSSPNCQ